MQRRFHLRDHSCQLAIATSPNAGGTSTAVMTNVKDVRSVSRVGMK